MDRGACDLPPMRSCTRRLPNPAAELGRVVGVLSTGGGQDCPDTSDPFSEDAPNYTFGRLARVRWGREGAGREESGQAVGGDSRAGRREDRNARRRSEQRGGEAAAASLGPRHGLDPGNPTGHGTRLFPPATPFAGLAGWHE